MRESLSHWDKVREHVSSFLLTVVSQLASGRILEAELCANYFLHETGISRQDTSTCHGIWMSSVLGGCMWKKRGIGASRLSAIYSLECFGSKSHAMMMMLEH